MTQVINNILLWIVVVCAVSSLTILLNSEEDSYKPSDEIQIEEICVDDHKILVFVRSGKIVGVIHDPCEYMDDPVPSEGAEVDGAIIY